MDQSGHPHKGDFGSCLEGGGLGSKPVLRDGKIGEAFVGCGVVGGESCMAAWGDSCMGENRIVCAVAFDHPYPKYTSLDGALLLMQ